MGKDRLFQEFQFTPAYASDAEELPQILGEKLLLRDTLVVGPMNFIDLSQKQRARNKAVSHTKGHISHEEWERLAYKVGNGKTGTMKLKPSQLTKIIKCKNTMRKK